MLAFGHYVDDVPVDSSEFGEQNEIAFIYFLNHFVHTLIINF